MTVAEQTTAAAQLSMMLTVRMRVAALLPDRYSNRLTGDILNTGQLWTARLRNPECTTDTAQLIYDALWYQNVPDLLWWGSPLGTLLAVRGARPHGHETVTLTAARDLLPASRREVRRRLGPGSIRMVDVVNLYVDMLDVQVLEG